MGVGVLAWVGDEIWFELLVSGAVGLVKSGMGLPGVRERR